MCNCQTYSNDSCVCSKANVSEQKKEYKFDRNWPYGHQTTDGRDAKFLGTACCDICLGWMVEDKFIATDRKGFPLSKHNIQIINKPVPSRWYNLYWHDKTIQSGDGYVSKELALSLAKHMKDYITTIEVPPKKIVETTGYL
jgi:hypothetical protein